MTTDYMENERFKKRYLAPLVVIMLCAVALTGAAYAYTTSVSGNGDIAGNYVMIDMYSDDGATSASGELQFDGSNLFKVYTATDRTDSTATAPCVAKVDESIKVNIYTYVRINTDLKDGDNQKQFTLGQPTLNLIKLDDYKGKIAIKTQEIKITDPDGEEVPAQESESGGDYTLYGNTIYKVEYTLTFTGGDTNGNFGTFTDSAAVKAAVDQYTNGDTKELTVMFTAIEKASTA